ncbi:MAG: sterol desaturase family protein [Myxococcales bacterium]|nr:sterol desaturase family protein [Myxococcales bacterium]
MAWIIVGLGLAFIVVERVAPARPLPIVRGWWPRAIALNAAQLGVVFLGGLTWDAWFGGASLFHLGDLGPLAGGVSGYVVTTFLYYWWHRARHASPTLWRLFHQLHHAPSRLEVITAFHKHPAEMAANGVLSAAIAFGLLGLSLEAAAVNTLLCGLAEFFYHWNVRTPWWLGFLIQRPEMHRIHHEAGAHRHNYGDLPIWDLLFGTFENPRSREVACGFTPELEARTWAMLAGHDVHAPTPRRLAVTLLLVLGLAQMAGAALARVAPGGVGETLAGLGRLTVASPNPKVFTRAGDEEPFGFSFEIEALRVDGRHERVALDARRYARMEGPYLYRNVYGAMLAFADFLPPETVEAVLRHGLCTTGHLAAVLDAGAPIATVRVTTRAGGVGPAPAPRTIACAEGAR